MKIYETTNKKWYHKDDVEIQLNINDTPPEGFIPGRKSENNEKDWETLYNWQLKASERKNRYSWAIKIWTERDLLKLATFRKNHLNFQIIYKDITITK